MSSRWKLLALAALLAAPAGLSNAAQPPAAPPLTDDQKSQLDAVAQARKKALAPLFAKRRELRKAVDAQVDAKLKARPGAGRNSVMQDPDVQPTVAQLVAAEAALKEQEAAFQAQADAILTPEQRASKGPRNIPPKPPAP